MFVFGTFCQSLFDLSPGFIGINSFPDPEMVFEIGSCWPLQVRIGQHFLDHVLKIRHFVGFSCFRVAGPILFPSSLHDQSVIRTVLWCFHKCRCPKYHCKQGHSQRKYICCFKVHLSLFEYLGCEVWLCSFTSCFGRFYGGLFSVLCKSEINQLHRVVVFD